MQQKDSVPFLQKGYVVVSGLAKGIDAAAHQGALRANGITIAVLAHGLDTIYPVKTRNLQMPYSKTMVPLFLNTPGAQKLIVDILWIEIEFKVVYH